MDEVMPTKTETISPIEEAKQSIEALSKLRDEIKTEREKLEAVHANAIIGGKSLLGNQIEKTDKEQADEEARRIIKMLHGK